jgi:hypothetical protein
MKRDNAALVLDAVYSSTDFTSPSQGHQLHADSYVMI